MGPPGGCRSQKTTDRLGRSAPVAQLDRASVYGTEGQRFESSRARSELPANQHFLAEHSESPNSAALVLPLLAPHVGWPLSHPMRKGLGYGWVQPSLRRTCG